MGEVLADAATSLKDFRHGGRDGGRARRIGEFGFEETRKFERRFRHGRARRERLQCKFRCRVVQDHMGRGIDELGDVGIVVFEHRLAQRLPGGARVKRAARHVDFHHTTLNHRQRVVAVFDGDMLHVVAEMIDERHRPRGDRRDFDLVLKQLLVRRVHRR